jgi:hypothetical protein
LPRFELEDLEEPSISNGRKRQLQAHEVFKDTKQSNTTFTHPTFSPVFALYHTLPFNSLATLLTYGMGAFSLPFFE